MSAGVDAGGGPGDPLAEARRLDAEAMGLGEEGADGRELRARAARLRVEALGERPYPVLVCTSCFRLTGWTTAEGACDFCARRAAARAAERASGGWLPAAAATPSPEAAGGAPSRGFAARLGGRRRRAEADARAWIAVVDPGETGPIEPAEGFELESAARDEVERLDGAGVLVRFHTATRRFVDGGWVRLPTSTIGRSLLPNPAEFAADLEVSVLVDAWADYQEAVAAINRARWREREAAEEAELARARAREQALAEQAHASELLQE